MSPDKALLRSSEHERENEEVVRSDDSNNLEPMVSASSYKDLTPTDENQNSAKMVNHSVEMIFCENQSDVKSLDNELLDFNTPQGLFEFRREQALKALQ